MAPAVGRMVTPRRSQHGPVAHRCRSGRAVQQPEMRRLRIRAVPWMQDGKREAFTTPLEMLHGQSHLLDFAHHDRAAVRRPRQANPTRGSSPRSRGLAREHAGRALSHLCGALPDGLYKRERNRATRPRLPGRETAPTSPTVRDLPRSRTPVCSRGGGSVVGAAGTERTGMTCHATGASLRMTCTIWYLMVSRGNVWHRPDWHRVVS
jgi:hypothetical protein